MRNSIPSGHVGAALRAFLLGCLVGPFVGYVFMFSWLYYGKSGSLNFAYVSQHFSWREVGGLLIGTYVFGLIPAAFSSMVCSLYLYYRRPPSVLIALFSTLPLCVLFLVLGHLSSPVEGQWFGNGVLYICGIALVFAAVSWLVAWSVMRKIYSKNDPHHP
jgi:formate hydrogenlyase subunit 3/multisubunit Na+/H+ antiporter MnhD subunit